MAALTPPAPATVSHFRPSKVQVRRQDPVHFPLFYIKTINKDQKEIATRENVVYGTRIQPRWIGEKISSDLPRDEHLLTW